MDNYFDGYMPTQTLAATDSQSDEDLDDAAQERQNKLRKLKFGDKSKNTTTSAVADSIIVNPSQALIDYARRGCIEDDEDDEDDEAEYEQLLQRMLRGDMLPFRNSIYYGPGKAIFSLEQLKSKESAFGLMVPIPGRGDRVPLIEHACRRQLSVGTVLGLAIVDMGVRADTSTPYTEFRRQMAQNSKEGEPFAVVSIAPGTVVEGNLDESSLKATRAVKFLQEKLKGCSSLSGKETAEIAVNALKYLWGPKLKPSEIKAKTSGFGNVYKLIASMDLTTS
ncbi:hypothetical protein OROMI_010729 [Orobanche minor]